MQKNVQCLLNGTALKAFGKEASAIHLCKDAATEHEWDFLIPQWLQIPLGIGFKEETKDGLVAAATLWLSPNT